MAGESQLNPKTEPDPSVLTTEQLDKAIDNLEKLLKSKLETIEAKYNGELSTVDKQFELVESRRVEQKKDTKDAVDAALSAAKEAVKEQTTASERSIVKSETATAKQLEQLSNTFKTEISGVVTSLSDIKERVSKLESLKQGNKEAYASLYLLAGLLIGIIGIVIAVVLK